MNRMPSQVLSFSTPLQALTQHVQIPSLLHLDLVSLGVWLTSTYSTINAQNWIHVQCGVCSLVLTLIKKDIAATILQNTTCMLAWMLLYQKHNISFIGINPPPILRGSNYNMMPITGLISPNYLNIVVQKGGLIQGKS